PPGRSPPRTHRPHHLLKAPPSSITLAFGPSTRRRSDAGIPRGGRGRRASPAAGGGPAGGSGPSPRAAPPPGPPGRRAPRRAGGATPRHPDEPHGVGNRLAARRGADAGL